MKKVFNKRQNSYCCCWLLSIISSILFILDQELWWWWKEWCVLCWKHPCCALCVPVSTCSMAIPKKFNLTDSLSTIYHRNCSFFCFFSLKTIDQVSLQMRPPSLGKGRPTKKRIHNYDKLCSRGDRCHKRSERERASGAECSNETNN